LQTARHLDGARGRDRRTLSAPRFSGHRYVRADTLSKTRAERVDVVKIPMAALGTPGSYHVGRFRNSHIGLVHVDAFDSLTAGPEFDIDVISFE
jgi:hypothetical protein